MLSNLTIHSFPRIKARDLVNYQGGPAEVLKKTSRSVHIRDADDEVRIITKLHLEERAGLMKKAQRSYRRIQMRETNDFIFVPIRATKVKTVELPAACGAALVTAQTASL